MKTTPVKGTLDFAPLEMQKRDKLINIIKDEYKKNGFLLIQTPILENLENLCSSDDGDNSKMMFKTLKRGEKLEFEKDEITENDLASEGLRYDLTVPLARFYAGNKETLPKVFKSIQIGDSFRAEKPQKGRFREFTQCDVDIFGDSTNMAEIELLITAFSTYKRMGIKNAVAKINDRRILNALILNSGFDEGDITNICIVIDKLDKIGIDNVKAELVNLNLDESKVETLTSNLMQIKQKGISALSDANIDSEIISNMQEIIDTVSNYIDSNYSIEFDITVIRGQSYYTGTVYEMFALDADYKRAIGGGGRYDKMLALYLGQQVSAVGFSIGLDSALVVLNNDELPLDTKIALIVKKDADKKSIFNKKQELKQNADVSIFEMPKNFNDFITRIKSVGFTHIYKLETNELKEI